MISSASSSLPRRINVIRALTISQTSAAAPHLAYPLLSDEVQRAGIVVEAAHETRQASDIVATSAVMTQQLLAEQLKARSLVQTARAIQQSQNRDEEARLSRRFTATSTELYGAPDVRLAQDITSSELKRFKQRASANSDDLHLVETCYDLLSPGTRASALSDLSHTDEADPPSELWIRQQANDLTTLLAPVLRKRYAYVFEAIPKDQVSFTPQQVVRLFENILETSTQRDPAWREWSVLQNQTGTLSVNSTARSIQIGQHRAPIARSELTGLIAHELLVHAVRSINGGKTGIPELAEGLPGYTAYEEGLGILFEVAMTSEVPQKIFDRYVDCALALQGVPRTRLLAMVCARARLRESLQSRPSDDDRIRVSAWTHVNRLYRGTRGGEIVGVFTKDALYLTGFIRVLNHMLDELRGGQSMDELLDVVLAAKFDPTNMQQRAMVAKTQAALVE